MFNKFYKICIIFIGLSFWSFPLWSNTMPDSLSSAIAHFDMSQGHSMANVDRSFGYSDLGRESTILAIREMRVSQGYGDPLYKKFYDLSIVRYYGALNFSFNMNTRQTEADLFPSPYLPDVIGRDIDAHGKTTIRASLSHFGVFFNPYTGMTEADIYGIIEFNFIGVVLETQYTPILKHAFGEIVWNTGAFLFGQYYHPLFLKESFARTIDLSLGAPFDPRGLAPQVRFSQRIEWLEFIIALTGESFIKTYGPLVVADAPSLSFIQNGIAPNVHFQAKYITGCNFYGGAINYKRIAPRLVSSNDYKVNEQLNSIIGEVYAHNVFPWGELNLKAVYSQDGSDQLLISGFAVKTVDPVTDFRTYVNTAAVSVWLDVFCVFFRQELSLGLFAGGAYNLGSSSSLYIDPTTNQPLVFALSDLAKNLLYTVRVSPRLVFARDAFRFGFECAWNGASFGCLNNYAQVINAVPVNTFSYTISLDYVF